MKVLVTGGAGYIFSRGIPELLKWEKDGKKVITELISVDNLMFNQCCHYEASLDPRYKFVKQDITDFDAMEQYYDWADVIIPAACITGAPLSEQMRSRAWEVNYSAIRFMVSHLIESGQKDKRIIVLVSNSGYGIKPPGVLTVEEDELNPVSTYGKTKVSLEETMKQYPSVVYRLATVFGVSNFHRIGLLVNTLVYKAMKEKVLPIYQGHYQRNYLYIGDCIQAVKLGIEKYDEMRGQVYNVGDTNANMTKMELAQLVAKHTGAEIIEVDNIQDPDKRSYLVSNAKIEAMGFRASTSIEEAIQELIRFYPAVDERSHNVYFGTT